MIYKKKTEPNSLLALMTNLEKFAVRHTFLSVICSMILVLSSIIMPSCAPALEIQTDGAKLFDQHCSGCHLHGGNIIRRNKTLKKEALMRYDLASPEAIAKVAREGLGQMNGYGDRLGENGDLLVAKWIWQQAQNAWIQG